MNGDTETDHELLKAPPVVRTHLVLLRCFNIFLYIILGIIAAIIGVKIDPFDFLAPSTFGIDPDTGAIGKSSDLSYPIFLGGEECFEDDMATCTDASTSVCCTELTNPNSGGPGEAVNTSELMMVSILFPVLALLLRACLVGSRSDFCLTKALSLCGRRGRPAAAADGANGDSKPDWHALVCFSSWDAWIGLLASLAMASLMTELTKLLVGRPRPNYYALRYFGEHSIVDQGSIHDATRSANTSWVSGHSSLSLAGVLFLTLVLWRDVSVWLVRWGRPHRAWLPLVTAMAYFTLIWIPILTLLVGISRMRDYWHRPEDVLGGWIVGALCAVYAWRIVTLLPYALVAFSPSNAILGGMPRRRGAAEQARVDVELA
eukprot:TRINITY_DN1011_c0_g2_i1.p1 TRINITY_DN1011_c0_g2~~TRINITY_DN1011_c0_g2_i1.p1  ORF type:complete len:374 (-),score=139.21 TRINITY_DN1011_c0_g2_i1:659-1780(-)